MTDSTGNFQNQVDTIGRVASRRVSILRRELQECIDSIARKEIELVIARDNWHVANL